jgi:diguanylate cyclase (GGDEF)-like protein/hemerythrin-like metal-binding protein/PAS domain S-box-containing protein
MLVLKIAAVVFVTEFVIMLAVTAAGLGSDFARALADTTLLTLVASTVIYAWIIRPYARARDAAEHSMRWNETRWRFALEAAGAGVWELDVATGEMYCSPRCKELLGYAEDEIECSIDEWVRRTDPEQQLRVRAALQECLEGRSAEYRFEHRMHAKDGSWRWILCRAMVIRGEDFKPLRIIGTHADITEQKRVQDELRSLATVDALTELSNRRHFLDRLEQAWSLHRRQPEQPVAVLMVDIDHFKRVNDSHGHAVGDAALRHFASLLRGHLRKADAAGRLGGEEFAVALLGASLQAAEAFAERLRASVAATPLEVDGRVVRLTVSVGVAEMGRGDDGAQAALVRADEALYRAKQEGRDRVEVAAPGRKSPPRKGFVRLVWHQAYGCGDETIDGEHRELFDTANRLFNAIVDDSPHEQVAALIAALVADTKAHFRDEEALLRDIGYPGLEQHRVLHEMLVARADELALRHAQGKAGAGEVFGFIAYDMLARHLLTEDRKYFALLARRCEGSAATC